MFFPCLNINDGNNTPDSKGNPPLFFPPISFRKRAGRIRRWGRTHHFNFTKSTESPSEASEQSYYFFTKGGREIYPTGCVVMKNRIEKNLKTFLDLKKYVL
ncbi:hypothetical protein CDAR_597621 [Caerostris darwini]|uniref:Uncharacterized protein n=1 Tax=Caerostris darwini TaxID=1538125 RepID=A0AAV4X292_9ARAC|nr:hypothetical protein CDAR_597621 [Caerostris darwini]